MITYPILACRLSRGYRFLFVFFALRLLVKKLQKLLLDIHGYFPVYPVQCVELLYIAIVVVDRAEVVQHEIERVERRDLLVLVQLGIAETLLNVKSYYT